MAERLAPETPIAYSHENPKQAGSKAYGRYERYKWGNHGGGGAALRGADG